MPITNNSSLDTAYANAVSAFDTLKSELETAATEEEAVTTGGENSEYQLGSHILASKEWRRVADKVEQMRTESSA
jgi:hypothetical protein